LFESKHVNKVTVLLLSNPRTMTIQLSNIASKATLVFIIIVLFPEPILANESIWKNGISRNGAKRIGGRLKWYCRMVAVAIV
jgi:hypothetical protein